MWRLPNRADERTFRFVMANPEFARVVGVSADGLRDRAVAEQFPGLMHTGALEVCRRVILSRTAADLGDLPFLDPRGRVIALRARAVPLPHDRVCLLTGSLTETGC